MIIWQQIMNRSGVGGGILWGYDICTVYVCVHFARVCVRECLRVYVCVWIVFIFADDVYNLGPLCVRECTCIVRKVCLTQSCTCLTRNFGGCNWA